MPTKTKSKSLPPRSKVKPADQWDLSSLFKSDKDWESAFQKWEKQIPGYEKFKGHLGDSAEMLAAALRFDAAVDRQGERLGVYAYLKTTEDQGNLQLTVGRGTDPDTGAETWLLDADIDENGALLAHLGDLFKHRFTGGTHPIDIHEYLLVAHAGIDLGYTLE